MIMASLPQPESRTSFPQELVDYIIDHYHDDIHTLRALALVSKSWLVPARYYIFHTLSVEPSVNPGRLSASLRLLAAGPSVCLSVRELTVTSVELISEQFLPMLSQPQRLKQLHLRHVVFVGALPPLPFAQLSRGIDILPIWDCYVTEEAWAVLELIKLFPSISELTAVALSSWSARGLEPPLSLRRTHKTHLGSLAYYDNFVGNDKLSTTMAQLIIKLLDDTSLTSLKLVFPNKSEGNALLLSTASPNLKSVIFSLEGTSENATTPVLDLSSCTTLESVTFRFHTYPASAPNGAYWENTYDIISTLTPSSSVSTVVFLIVNNRSQCEQSVKLLFDTSTPSWRKLEQALGRMP